MNLNLAVIGQITALSSIKGADRIMQATVDCGDAGQWTGVVGLDHQVCDLVTVFLQDAILPPDPRWAFMERSQWRVRMARFKGVPSECVIVKGAPDMPPGTDMTETLGVTKYSKPVPAGIAGDAVGSFPSFIPRTDEINFQAAQEQVEALAGKPWEARVKYDGTSCTVWRGPGGALHVASRNLELREYTATGAENVYWRAARRYNWDKLPHGLAMQFEVVGPGVQGNPAGVPDIQGRAFHLYDILSRRSKPGAELDAMAAQVGIPAAEVVQAGDAFSFDPDALRAMAQALKYSNGKPAEGVVVRSLDHGISFKVISLSYKD